MDQNMPHYKLAVAKWDAMSPWISAGSALDQIKASCLIVVQAIIWSNYDILGAFEKKQLTNDLYKKIICSTINQNI